LKLAVVGMLYSLTSANIHVSRLKLRSFITVHACNRQTDGHTDGQVDHKGERYLELFGMSIDKRDAEGHNAVSNNTFLIYIIINASCRVT